MADHLEWHKNYLVGDRVADAEHQKIVHLVNTFLKGLSEGKAPRILDAILDQLLEVSRAHFKGEEAKMKKEADTAAFIRHKDDHDNLLKELRMLKDGYARAKLGVEDVLPFFRDWIFGHIEKNDRGIFQPTDPENQGR